MRNAPMTRREARRRRANLDLFMFLLGALPLGALVGYLIAMGMIR